MRQGGRGQREDWSKIREIKTKKKMVSRCAGQQTAEGTRKCKKRLAGREHIKGRKRTGMSRKTESWVQRAKRRRKGKKNET